ncbi:hypothetical protein BKA93DRAFT_726555 [Sparassis latifolia]|uniref:Diaminohydroxyphosphoribosylamino-pyrimidine deaminase n=1 Tax=Sparassis crispa TaxID=139825 RepID=A0A401GHE6_9APHY|nr:Diaminohydroxyphosphoribosylamino-pyrimidine deaminase [Sparassis crispa]GBE81541.1 Diaminohydroxyphosphoribosylamino-pyrimidine deaminase [Sparassis crispa]
MAADSREVCIFRGPVQLPPGSTLVSDADEEVFLQYTNLATHGPLDITDGFRGLGHVDSCKDVLTITFKVDISKEGDANATIGRRSKRRSHRSGTEVIEKVFEVELAQDKTAFRTRKGDTGSVVWRASVDFAQLILRQYHTRDPQALLNPAFVSETHILELGAGTGLLGIVFSSLVARYTVTDIEALVPLMQKNLENNLPNFSPPPAKHPSQSRKQIPYRPGAIVTAEALDWQTLLTASPYLRHFICPFAPVDLLLVVDCIYHPSLLPALLATIDYLTIPSKTAVLVVIELRAEDVVREFLEGWLNLSPNGLWEIWSVPDVMEGPYAVWIGWKCLPLAEGPP